jgi:hypothetical protein
MAPAGAIDEIMKGVKSVKSDTAGRSAGGNTESEPFL